VATKHCQQLKRARTSDLRLGSRSGSSKKIGSYTDFGCSLRSTYIRINRFATVFCGVVFLTPSSPESSVRAYPGMDAKKVKT